MMHLAKYRTADGATGVGVVQDNRLTPLCLNAQTASLADLLNAVDPQAAARALLPDDAASSPLADVTLLAPIDRQEVWAAGVTYKRSKTARMEESKASASCYDLVYEADRPEIFYKAAPHRVRGPGEPLRIRVDSQWNVPEPELGLAINVRGEIAGFTVGNDMSSRDIEGANPLYLPQAKVYDACCGLGPWITLFDERPPLDAFGIAMTIVRDGAAVLDEAITAAQMARGLDDLVAWLWRENSFPDGVFLLTGTGIIPDSRFTLQPGDVVRIRIDGVGVLENPVLQGT